MGDFVVCLSVAAQQDVKPMTYEQFKEQKDLQTDKGFYTVYRLNDQYYLEIPAEGLGKEVLTTTQVAHGRMPLFPRLPGDPVLGRAE